VLIGFGVAGCAAILGIDDRKLDTVIGDASSDTTADGSGEESSPSTDGRAADAAVQDGSLSLDGGVDGGMDAVGPSQDGSSGDAPTVDVNRDALADAITCPDPCVLATGLNHPFDMKSDANNVYWTEFGDGPGSGNGSVKGCPVTGCGAGPTVYAQGLVNPRGIAVDSSNIYFGAVGAVYACSIGGCTGALMQLASADQPYGVSVDATYVYWVDYGSSTVHRVPKGGGADTVLYDAGDGLVYEPFQCTVDGQFIYFMDYDENAFRLAITGGSPALLGSGNNNSVYGNAFGITTDPSSVYFGGNGIILRAEKTIVDSGAPISTRVPLAVGLTYDPSTSMIYWANWGSGAGSDGTVGKMAGDGGSAEVLAAGLDPPEGITLSGAYVLWISSGVWGDAGDTLPGTGTLLRRSK
jgi:hypothetical protein